MKNKYAINKLKIGIILCCLLIFIASKENIGASYKNNKNIITKLMNDKNNKILKQVKKKF